MGVWVRVVSYIPRIASVVNHIPSLRDYAWNFIQDSSRLITTLTACFCIDLFQSDGITTKIRASLKVKPLP